MSSLSWLEDLSSGVDEEGMLELASRLIEKNTVSPPGNECRVKDILIEHLKKIGAEVKIFEPAPGRSSVLGYVGKGRPCVAIVSHMDVVPPGKGWDFDPFSPRIKQGRIYGRGAIDNKGPFAASWAGIKALLDTGISLNGTIILGAVADEERGSRYGLQYILEEGFRPDFCIIPDGGKLNEMVIGEKGRMEVYLHTRGKSAHGSQPEKGENAIYKMVDYLGGLKNFTLKGEHHHLFEPATINLGQVEGGQAPNIVPDGCRATVDVRYPLGMSEEGVLSQLKTLILESGVEIEKRNLSVAPHLLSTEHPLVRVFKEMGENFGVCLKVATMGGITLAKNLYFREIPAVVHSPATQSVAHQANEYANIKNLIICAKLWAAVAGKLASGQLNE